MLVNVWFCSQRQDKDMQGRVENLFPNCTRFMHSLFFLSISLQAGCKLCCNNDVALSFHPAPGHSPTSNSNRLMYYRVHGEENFLVSLGGGWVCLHPRCANIPILVLYVGIFWPRSPDGTELFSVVARKEIQRIDLDGIIPNFLAHCDDYL